MKFCLIPKGFFDFLSILLNLKLVNLKTLNVAIKAKKIRKLLFA